MAFPSIGPYFLPVRGKYLPQAPTLTCSQSNSLPSVWETFASYLMPQFFPSSLLMHLPYMIHVNNIAVLVCMYWAKLEFIEAFGKH